MNKTKVNSLKDQKDCKSLLTRSDKKRGRMEKTERTYKLLITRKKNTTDLRDITKTMIEIVAQ